MKDSYDRSFIDGLPIKLEHRCFALTYHSTIISLSLLSNSIKILRWTVFNFTLDVSIELTIYAPFEYFPA